MVCFFLKTVIKEYREKIVEREYPHLLMLNYLVLRSFTELDMSLILVCDIPLLMGSLGRPGWGLAGQGVFFIESRS